MVNAIGGGNFRNATEHELDRGAYMPTEEEIRAECEKIRDGWPEWRKRGISLDMANEQQGVEVPFIDRSEIHVPRGFQT